MCIRDSTSRACAMGSDSRALFFGGCYIDMYSRCCPVGNTDMGEYKDFSSGYTSSSIYFGQFGHQTEYLTEATASSDQQRGLIVFNDINCEYNGVEIESLSVNNTFGTLQHRGSRGLGSCTYDD